MTRCDEFYEKWERDGNFCGLDPDTAAGINRYLDERKKLREEAAKCAKIEPEYSALAEIDAPEKALRPLIYEKDEKTKTKIVHKMLNKAKEKIESGEDPILTTPEISTIVTEVREEEQEEKCSTKDRIHASVKEIVDKNPESFKFKEEIEPREISITFGSSGLSQAPDPTKERSHYEEKLDDMRAEVKAAFTQWEIRYENVDNWMPMIDSIIHEEIKSRQDAPGDKRT